MFARRIVAAVVLLSSLILTSGAAAKHFGPGDLSVCSANRCVSIRSQPTLNALAAFYYDSAKPPARVRAPSLGVRFFQLEFSNRYITGIVAGTNLTRFLSYGVNLDQFQSNAWYRVPAGAVAELRRLTSALTPLHLTAAAITYPNAFAVPSSGAGPPRPQAVRRAAHGGQANLPWALVILPLAALVAFALLARRRRRPVAAQLPAQAGSPE